MAASDTGYIVWGSDTTAYGPVELPDLIAWIKDGRVTADTWVYSARATSWQKASLIAELQLFFRDRKPAAPVAAVGVKGIDPRALRRVKILAGMTDAQLTRFAEFMEVEKVPQWTVIVKQGDHGDAMFLILEGELRVRINDLGREAILATLGPGDFFGDISLFDHGPRSADVVANSDALLLRISSGSIEELSKAAPELAAPFLRNIGQTLSARIRADNKRFRDSVRFA